ncbi:MAG: lipopolysaccharide kinase InaA family protein, partial [Gemmatimonadales bacterium]
RIRAWGVDEASASDLMVRAKRSAGLPGAWSAGVGSAGPGRDDRRGPQGRGPVVMLDIGGRDAVLKRHARGGLFGRLCRVLSPDAPAIYLGHGRLARLAELTHRFEARGGRTPRFLGWIEVRRRGPFRSHYSATERVPGAEPLPVALSGEPARRREALAHLASHLAAWHQAGLRHPDLNSGNILRSRGPDSSIWVIDLDRSRLGRNVGAAARARMLARLFRSLAHQKLEPGRRESLRLASLYARERVLLEGLPHVRRRSLARTLLRGLAWRRQLFVVHGLPRARG